MTGEKGSQGIIPEMFQTLIQTEGRVGNSGCTQKSLIFELNVQKKVADRTVDVFFIF